MKTEINYEIKGNIKYYTYKQNNSGGYFKGPAYVIIKAGEFNNIDEIASELLNVDIYFGGFVDCPCCGDRWSKFNESWEEITDTPQIYKHHTINFNKSSLCTDIGIIIPSKYKHIQIDKTINLIEEFNTLESAN